MKDIVFREYDIRGRVGTDFILDDVYALGRALVYYFLQKKPDAKTIAVGMDGRIHSPYIKNELIRACLDSGLDVMYLGLCPSPAFYFAMHTRSVDAGIMVTASHNPKDFNGMKMYLQHDVVWGDEIVILKQWYLEKRSISGPQGAVHVQPIVPDYISWLVAEFVHLKGALISAVIDCGNGMAGVVLPELVKQMQWSDVSLLHDEVDGNFPCHDPDPTVEKNMGRVKQILAVRDYALGIGFDGDADRMVAMKKDGTLLLGDILLAIFAEPLLQKYPKSTIVFDIKSSSVLVDLLNKWGATPCMTPTGHTHVKSQMKETGALLGGELSCHFFFKDRYFGYDDGIYAMFRLFEIMVQKGKTIEDLVKNFPQTYSSSEYRLSCDEFQKHNIITHTKDHFEKDKDVIKIITIDGVRVEFHDGWGMVRASNTQEVLSLRFEGNTSLALKRIKQRFIDVLACDFDRAILIKELELE